MGVVDAQGFLWSPAVPAADIDSFLAVDHPFEAVTMGVGPEGAGGAGGSAGELRSVSSLAHELRSPITAIVGYAELLDRDAAPTPAARERAVAAIVRNARAAMTVVCTVSDLARLDDGTLPLDLRAIDLGVFAGELADDLRRTTSHPVVVVAGDGAVVVRADEGRLRQIVWNLLANAVRFSPPDETVEVAVEARATGSALVVRDRGPGIAPADAARMFRRYARLDGARSGTGLGLYLGSQLAAALGGHLRYRARRPHGSEFELLLPNAPATSPDPG
jgi:two-component system OmpR family sensor kinase